MTVTTPVKVEQRHRDAAEVAVGAANIVSHAGYYEADIEGVAQAFASFEASLPLAQMKEALQKWQAYDQLLRRYAGPLSMLCEGDVPKIDAAYDDCVGATSAVLQSQEPQR